VLLVLFVGDDWAEAHHDIEVQDETGRRLVRRRLPEGMAGIAQLHELIGQHVGQDGGELDDPAQVVVGIETDRGPWVQALLAAGYQVFAINPLSVARYRERHTTSGAKSDPGDAKVLADLVRTDRQHHRPIAGDSQLAEAVKVLARAHQGVCWMRGRQANLLRSTLREFYPGALQAFDELTHPDALAVLELAPTPGRGRSLSRNKIASALRRAGRQRNIEARAEQIQTALRAPQLEQPPLIADAFGSTVTAYVTLLAASVAQVRSLEGQLEQSFGQHPAAEIVLSQPGLGTVLGARVLAEFGDDPHRYASPKARKNYAGTAPITRASGTRRVVLAVSRRTSGCGTPCTCKPSPRSTPALAPGPTTTPAAPTDTPTTRRSAPSATASSASSTAAYATAPSTTKPPPGPATSSRTKRQLDELEPWDV
jgi:transposase